jgi:hypothetical protein
MPHELIKIKELDFAAKRVNASFSDKDLIRKEKYKRVMFFQSYLMLLSSIEVISAI